jgi:hypothetical protein
MGNRNYIYNLSNKVSLAISEEPQFHARHKKNKEGGPGHLIRYQVLYTTVTAISRKDSKY